MQDYIYRQIEDGTFAVVGYKGDEAEIVIPQSQGKGISFVGDRLFSGHPEITSVKMPDTVTDLGEFLFDGCLNLRHIELPPNLKYLWGYTFVRCGIEEIVLPDSLTFIPPFAFKDCKNLKKIVCGKGMKKIHAWAFGGCDKLEQMLCGPGVEINPLAFEEKVLNT